MRLKLLIFGALVVLPACHRLWPFSGAFTTVDAALDGAAPPEAGTDVGDATPGGPCGPFGTPTRLAELSSSAQEWSPAVWPDGKTIATRDSPTALTFTYQRALKELNTAGDDGWPTISTDGLEIFFERDRRILVSRRASPTGVFSPPTEVPELNLAGFDSGDPNLSPDGTTLYFSSSRFPSQNSDIWVAKRVCPP